MKATAKPVYFRPSPDIRDKLDELSSLTGIPINTMVGRAVSAYLDEIEQWYKLQPKPLSSGKGG